MGIFSQAGVKMKNIWNHHLVNGWFEFGDPVIWDFFGVPLSNNPNPFHKREIQESKNHRDPNHQLTITVAPICSLGLEYFTHMLPYIHGKCR